MPYLGSTVFVGSLVLLFFAGATAYFLLLLALAPGFVERTGSASRARPVASFSIGLFVSCFAFLVVAVLLSAAGGPVRLFGAIGLALVVGFVLAGLAGIAQQIGVALASSADKTSSTSVVARGSFVLLFAAALPVVGWFLVAPIALLVGTGAACLSLRRAPAPRAPVLAAPASPPTGWSR